MSLEFVDTNIFVYANEREAGAKHKRSCDLIGELAARNEGAVSIQVLAEFYATAMRKLRMSSNEAEDFLADLGVWAIHRPGHGDVLRSAALHRRLKVSWWDALIVNSALELCCAILWTEDMSDGRRIGHLTVRNPFL